MRASQPATLEVIRPQRFQFGRGRQSTSLRQTRSEHRRHRSTVCTVGRIKYNIGAGHFSGWLRSRMSECLLHSDSNLLTHGIDARFIDEAVTWSELHRPCCLWGLSGLDSGDHRFIVVNSLFVILFAFSNSLGCSFAGSICCGSVIRSGRRRPTPPPSELCRCRTFRAFISAAPRSCSRCARPCINAASSWFLSEGLRASLALR